MSITNIIVFSLNIKIEYRSAPKIPIVSTTLKIQNKLFFLHLILQKKKQRNFVYMPYDLKLL